MLTKTVTMSLWRICTYFSWELYVCYKRNFNSKYIRLCLQSRLSNNIDRLILYNCSHYCCEKIFRRTLKRRIFHTMLFLYFNRFCASFERLCLCHYIIYNYALGQKTDITKQKGLAQSRSLIWGKKNPDLFISLV